jgi:hypothetical protein
MKWPRFSPRFAGLVGFSALNAALFAGALAQLVSDGSVPSDKIEGTVNVSRIVKDATARKPFEVTV